MKQILRSLTPQTVRNAYHAAVAYYYNFRFGFPSRRLKIIGVTGTDGKTTTANLIYHILRSNNINVGLLSTISAKIGDEELDTGFHVTSPDPWDVPKYLHQMVESGVEWVVLEVTSHGLHQNRFFGITFEKAVFTNITHEHIDYHGSWESYADAKFLLVKNTRERGKVIINKDDAKGFAYIAKKIHEQGLDSHRVLGEYSAIEEIVDKNASVKGLRFVYRDEAFSVPLLGNYNFENCLAAIKATEDMLSLPLVKKALRNFAPLSGRMEVMQQEPFSVIVDFAHTSNALESTLKTINDLKRKDAQTIVVFGCAGLRDRQKRGMMGAVAARYADVIILTAEDPRTERLKDINAEIIAGAQSVNNNLTTKAFKKAEDIRRFESSVIYHNNVMNTSSRREAINLALNIASEGDSVIIAGKGHEKSLCFGEREYDWSDQDTVKALIGVTSEPNV